MAIKLKIYDTPRPNGREGEALEHARVISKGTRRMDDICETLIPFGLYTAQIKGILEGLVTYIGKSLQEGYHIELEDLGTFSLSANSRQIINKSNEPATEITIDSVNFRPASTLKKKIRKANIEIVKEGKGPESTLEQRKKKMLAYINKYGHISGMEYTRMNNCTRYMAQKDLNTFVEEKIISQVGTGTRKVFVIFN